MFSKILQILLCISLTEISKKCNKQWFQQKIEEDYCCYEKQQLQISGQIFIFNLYHLLYFEYNAAIKIITRPTKI
jgi:hypothetical protein